MRTSVGIVPLSMMSLRSSQACMQADVCPAEIDQPPITPIHPIMISVRMQADV